MVKRRPYAVEWLQRQAVMWRSCGLCASVYAMGGRDTITFPNESIHINRSRVPEMCSCVYVGSAGVNMQGSANCVVHE